MAYIKTGKGIAGIHAATDCFYKWEEFGAMMGGYFDGHPWNEQVTLKLDDPEHPVNAAFGGKPFVVADEIYQFKDPYSRDNVRVLLSLDPSGTNMAKNGMKRDDGDYAVSWVREYGRGRLFYCSLGHRHEIFWNTPVLEHYLAGIQWALGDLDGDATPNPLTEAEGEAAEASELSAALKEAAGYEFGGSRAALSLIAEQVRLAQMDDALRANVENGLCTLVRDPGATDESKDFACRQLALIGSGNSVPSLALLLKDERLSHMARYALDHIEGEAGSKALREAMMATEGDIRIGIITSLGRRRDGVAVEPMMKVVETADMPTLVAILDTLAMIGTVESVNQLLFFAEHTTNPEVAPPAMRAVMRAAERSEADGDPWSAASIYRLIYEHEGGEALKIAALCGLAETDPIQAAGLLLPLFDDPDPMMRNTAIRLVRTMKGAQVTELLSAQMGSLSPAAQVALLEGLARRGDRNASPYIVGLLKVDLDAAVESAALTALGDVGDAACVPMLVRKAAAGEKKAEASLHRLGADNVHNTLMELLSHQDAAVRLVAVTALEARGVTEAVGPLFRIARIDQDDSIRVSAITAIGHLGSSRHAMDMKTLLAFTESDATRTAAESALATLCLKADNPKELARRVYEGASALDGTKQAALVRVMGALGGDDALTAVRDALTSNDRTVVDAAIEALTNWSDITTHRDMLSLYQTCGRSGPVRDAVFQGYLNAARRPTPDMDLADRAGVYARLLAISQTTEGTRLVLQELTGVPHPEAMEAFEPYLSVEALRVDAAKGLAHLAKTCDDRHREAAMRAVTLALEAAGDNEQVRNLAGEAIDHLERNDSFITAWSFAGPYRKDKAGPQELFDVAFAPETGGDVEWIDLPAQALSGPGYVNLNTIDGNGNCCGYLRATLIVDRACAARLHVGSDDGIKVWVNGMLVHGNNALRGMNGPAEHCDVQLRPGGNTLMMKITNGGGGWDACCRIRGVDGRALAGVSIDPPR
jgi:type 1 glutamine amidotransferase/HEAT repeat protein